MLDAQFDEIIDQIDVWDERVKSAIRHDGVIAANAVRKSSLDPGLVKELSGDIQREIKSDVDTVKSALRAVENARSLAQAALARAQKVAAQVHASSEEVSGVRAHALEQLNSVISLAQDLLKRVETVTPFLENAENDAKLAEAVAMDWAQVSKDWAEYMPDTIPPNTLAWMGISGEHWSSRWWANRADNAFGRLTDLYLGASSDPPTQNLEGGPITTGSIYFDTDVGVPYIWNGTSWVPFYQPVRAVTMSLNYLATAGQTTFDLSTLDMNGGSHALATGEAAIPLVNGIRLAPSLGGSIGDYTLSGSVVTLLRPLRAGDLATFDVLVDPAKLTPGAVNNYAMVDINLDPATSVPGYQDGIRTIFQLRTRQTGIVVNVVRSEELLVSLDGVIQNPGVMFTASGSAITFTEAPLPDSEIFIVWSQTTPTAPAGAATLTYRSTVAKVATLAVETYAGFALGAGATGRLVVAVIHGRRTSAPGRTISSVTIAGVAATVVQVARAGTAALTSAIAYAVVPAGTTGDVVVTWSGALTESAVSLYTVNGLASPTPLATASAITGTDPATTINVPANGVVIMGVGGIEGTIGDITLTGVTENYDVTTGVLRAAAGSASALSVQTGRPVAGASTATTEALIAASWG